MDQGALIFLTSGSGAIKSAIYTRARHTHTDSDTVIQPGHGSGDRPAGPPNEVRAAGEARWDAADNQPKSFLHVGHVVFACNHRVMQAR